MQGQNSTSTLELVVNEQHMQHMSQIDLSRPGEAASSANPHEAGSRVSGQGFTFGQMKKWPSRFKESYNAKIDEAKQKSETKTEFIFKVIQAFSSIAVWILCFLCTITVPVILFFIGLLNLDNCQDRPALPYLIFATGFTMTASNLFNLALALNFPILTNHQILSSEIKNAISSIINILFNCVVIFLYILTCYMVFSIDISRNADRTTVNSIVSPDGPRFVGEDSTSLPEDNQQMKCSETLYYFAFWFATLTLGLIAILCLAAGLLYAYNSYRLAIIRGSTPRSQPQTTIPSQANTFGANRA